MFPAVNEFGKVISKHIVLVNLIGINLSKKYLARLINSVAMTIAID